MRFLSEGSDIPDAVIRAALSGDLTFLCGAGVSVSSDLPLFQGLTKLVYQDLGETPENEPSERIAVARQEFDRALRSLEKRTHRPENPTSRVRDAVARHLKAPIGIEFPRHQLLLKISKDSTGRPRILTTNFDTLFERAASTLAIGQLPSHAGKSLPKPGGPRDFGILHLHGRIADPDLGLDDTDLVLTSADFGDAYLRDGWASRYTEDRMRLGTLVLVGYAAEDAAFRLLLETLDADRDRFHDLKEVYAIERRKERLGLFMARERNQAYRVFYSRRDL